MGENVECATMKKMHQIMMHMGENMHQIMINDGGENMEIRSLCEGRRQFKFRHKQKVCKNDAYK